MPATAALRRLVPYYRPYRRNVAFGLFLVVAASAFASVIPWLLRRGLDGIRAGVPLRNIWWLAAAMIGIALVGGAMRYLMRELLNGVSRWIEYDLRNDLFTQLEVLDARFYTRHRTGDLMARLTNDLSAVRMAVGPAIMYLMNTIAGGAFALYFMLRIDGRLTAIAVLPMLLLPAIGLWMGKRIHERFEAVQEHFGNMTTMAQENIAGVRVVRAYRQEDSEIGRFAAMNEEYLARNMRLVKLYGAMHPSFVLLAGFGTVAVIALGGALVVRGQISVGSFVAFGLYLGMLTWPLIALGWVINLFQRGAASMGRLLNILDARSSLALPAHPRALPAHAPGQPAGRRVEYRNVGFHYPPGAHESADNDGRAHHADAGEPRWVLRHVSFTAPAGATIGIVGATGSGKSALMDLLPRLYDPQEGEILIDGVPITQLDLVTLRTEIGYVPQESFLFSDTIGSNLAYGSRNEEAGRWAAGIAQLSETIASFAGGFETMLGERGINLSGGQKQRAALARALARRPSIVLLDDALSAVDTHTEAEILHAWRTALAGRTALIASHRISAIRDASWIIVLDEGRVVEQGTHAELIAAGGRYWSLLNRQQLEESIEEEGDVDAEDSELAETLADGRIDR
ncbi:MAG TPA: ABC transporter ATP-binding protein [Gemmatimonadaceae bacterium]|nr:ABC transporter ATP-binding protein [Gemmatimonadaceae bacterium]